MSTRLYRMYQKGNPQLRIFLPNFWMKIVEPQDPQPANHVQFHCSMQMTKHDVKNYLEKIYNVQVKDVRTRIKLGKFKKTLNTGYVVKDDDIKVAHVVLSRDEEFVFPDILQKEEKKKEEKDAEKTMKLMTESHKTFLRANNKLGVPGWFGI